MWPLVAIVAIVVLRKNLRRLVDKIVERVPDLAELSAWGGTMRFEKSVNELENDAANIDVKIDVPPASATATAPPADVVTNDDDSPSNGPNDGGFLGPIWGSESGDSTSAIDDEFLANVLPHDPLGTVLAAYRDVEVAAADFLRRRGGTRTDRPVPRALTYLRKNDMLDPHFRKVILDLRDTRNLAAHSGTVVTPQAADRYERVAARVVEAFKRL